MTIDGSLFLGAGKISDAMLSSTFVKPSTAPSLTGTNFSGIPISAVTNLSTSLSNKQDVLTSGSVSDVMLSSTFVKPNTSPSLTGTNFSGIPQSGIINLTTDLANKQNTITNGSITDSMLSSTFLKPNTSISVTSLTCTSETDSGNLTAGSISEKYTSIGNNGTTNSYTLDYTGNTAVYILSTAPTANFTVRLNNCTTDTTKSITFAVVYNTTGKYYCNSITAYSDTTTQITLASSVPLFSGGSPNISTSTVMIQTFNLIRSFASNYVLSSVISYY